MVGEVELLGERIAEQAAHLDAATHRLLADLREFDARGGWRTQGASSCAHWLAWRVGWDLVTARQKVLVARKLGEFPTTDDALRRGELSYSKVRAVLRVATPANEAMLLDIARLSTASQLENLSHKYNTVKTHDKDVRPRDDEQRRYVRKRDTSDGMVKIEAVLHPEEAELVWSMLDHAAKQLVRTPVPPPASVPDDSAESAATTNLTAEAESAWTPARTAGDSAESAATTDLTTDTESGGTRPVGDFTESTAAFLVTTDAKAARPAELPPYDSAESEAVANITIVAAMGLPDAYPAGDPAESAPGSTTPSATADAKPARVAAHRIDDSAESDAVSGITVVAVAGPASAPAPAEDSARPRSVLQQAESAARRAFSRADALLAVAQTYLRGDRPNRTPIDVMLTIPASALKAGAADPTDAGRMGDCCVSAEAARRLSCDAGVIEVVEDEHGVPLSVGRKRRTIAGPIKRALLKRDTACTFPGCTHRIFLEGHHIQHWADGGETSLRNATLLCSLHHRYVHEHGYVIELDADQRPQFRDPHGRLVTTAPARSTAPDLGWPAIRAANETLEIDADTIACEWDGTPMPYGTLVGQLVVVDGLA